ncbi:Condensin complex subunit 1 [Raphanus sativus]|nr:Condensin complex subunit 1 [Raphanus sativus]
MAPPFVFPQIIRTLAEDPEDNHSLFAQNPVDGDLSSPFRSRRIRQSSLLDGLADHISSQCLELKIYIFFLIIIVMTEESHVISVHSTKVAARGRKKQIVQSWNWEPQRGTMLNFDCKLS